MDINFDITFPRMPCSWLSLDAMDVSGELQLEVDHDIYRQRLGSNGKPVMEAEKHLLGPQKPPEENATADSCGSCYGAETEERPCCGTCADIRDAYAKKGWMIANMNAFVQCHSEDYVANLKMQAKEGCHIWGDISINKVAGNFHFAPGRSYQQGMMHLHDLSVFIENGFVDFDFSHTIHKLTFGREYPGLRNPLDGALVKDDDGYRKSKSIAGGSSAQLKTDGGLFQYFLKVVPTMYTDLRNKTIHSNQYAVAEHYREANPEGGQQLPGVFFIYDLSPIKVRFIEEKTTFLTFMTGVAAIIGGVFTVSGMLDATVYHGQLAIKKKMDLGKFS